jgi:hypothetical protein
VRTSSTPPLRIAAGGCSQGQASGAPAECVAAAAVELINRGTRRATLAPWWRAGP